MRTLYFATLLVASIFPNSIKGEDGYSDPSGAQFHIQTDEGPERYFRYQTLSGQYRKEKRLEDGTVIGTSGWVDDDGFFRMKDYIADKAGYRILKTKNVYVGRNMPISQALKIAKKYPATEGAKDYTQPPVQTTVYNNPNNIYSVPIGFKVTHAEPPIIKYDTLPTQGQINVQVSSNSIVSTTPSSLGDTYTTPTIPAPSVLPPLQDNTRNYDTQTETYLSTTTPRSSFSSTPKYETQSYISPPLVPTLSPPFSSNALDSFYGGGPQYEHYSNNKPFVNPYIYHNGPTYPIDRNGNSYSGGKYDDISVTNDGFRYYIPKQYHEERELPGGGKQGSFGYVDPFGIRRVIYYDAGPNGFQHRKNNRYVGLGGAPYDTY